MNSFRLINYSQRNYRLMKILKNVKALVLTLIIFTTGIAAQQAMQMPQVAPADSVSDTELELFLEVAKVIQEIRMELDSVIIAKLDDEGMSTERFQTIMMSQQNPQAEEVALTSEEEETMAMMQAFLQEAGMNAQIKQLDAIQNSEMSQERFQSIAMAMQTDQSLAMRFQKMAMELDSK